MRYLTDTGGTTMPGSRHNGDFSASQVLSPEGIHVLLVDDERSSRLIVGTLLRQCRYTVTEADSGLTALETLRSQQPGTFNLILTDVMMPDVDGIELLKQIRTDPTFSSIPVVMMSANERNDTVFECIQGGAEDYLVKPVSKNAIQCIWQHVWRRQNAARVPQSQDEGEEELRTTSRVGAVPVVGPQMGGHVLGSASLASPQQVGPATASPIRRSASDDALNVADGPAEGSPDTVGPSGGSRRARPVRRQAPAPAPWPSPLLSGGALEDPQNHRLPRVASDMQLVGGRRQVVSADDLAVRGTSHRFASTSSAPELQGAEGPALADVHVDRSLLEYLEVRNRVDVAESLKLFEATVNMLAPSHHRGEAFKIVRPSLLWLGSDWVMRTMPRGPHHPVVSEEVRKLEAECYASPEELLGREPTPASDIYSLGVLCVELFHNYTRHGERKEVLRKIPHRYMPEGIFRSPALHGWVVSMLEPRAERRPTLVSVCKDPFVKNLAAELRLRQQAAVARALPPRTITRREARQHTVVTQAFEAAKKAEAEERDRQSQMDPAVNHLLISFLSKVKRKRKREARALKKQLALLQADLDYTTEQLEQVQAARAARQLQQQVSMVLPRLDQVRAASEASSQAEAMPDALALAVCSPRTGYGDPALGSAGPLALRPAPGAVGPARPSRRGMLLAEEKWRRMQPALESLQGVFFKRKRARQEGGHTEIKREESQVPLGLDGFDDCLTSFAEDLVNVSRYSQIKVRATLKYTDMMNQSDMVCSIAVDRDDELFATAGVSRRIKLFSLHDVLTSDQPMHYPRFEIATRAKLSSVAFNSYIKNKLVAADTDGMIALMDSSVGTVGLVYEEHTRTVRSVDFSPGDPSRFVSGSDDGTVRIWTVNCDRCFHTLDLKSPVCSVQWSPTNSPPHCLRVCQLPDLPVRRAQAGDASWQHRGAQQGGLLRALDGEE
eukprot:jgi/Botrbrau1/12744/Bobra.67_1s0103.1